MKTKTIQLASILLGLVMTLFLMPSLAIAEGPDSGVAGGGSKPLQAVQATHMSVFTTNTGKNLNAKVIEGDGALSYAVKNGADCIDVGSDGALTLKKAGAATVTVTAAETDTYAETSVDVPIKVYDTYEYEISFWAVQYAVSNRVFNLNSLDIKLFDKGNNEVGSKTVANPQRGNKVTLPATNFADRVEMTAHIQLPKSDPFTLTGSGGIGGAINVWNTSAHSGRVFTCNYGMNAPEPDFTPPVAKPSLTANGSDQVLAYPGSVSVGGTVQYCFGTESKPNNDWAGLGWVKAKNPGTYYVWWRIHNTDYTARYIGQGRSELGPQCIKVTIGKGTISPTVNIEGWTYGEAAKTPTVTGNTGNGAVTYEYKVQGTDNSTYTTTVPTDAGAYTVRATIADTTSYSGGAATKDFTIAKAAALTQDVRVVGLMGSVDGPSAHWEANITQPLAGMMPDGAGVVAYEASAPTYADGTTALPEDVASFASQVDASTGVVTAKLEIPSSAADVPAKVQKITLPVTVESKNYKSSTINVIVVPTARTEKKVTITSNIESKTFGDADFTLTATVEDGETGENNWYWYSSDPHVLEVEAENGSNQMQVRVRGVGSAQILAWYEPSGGNTIGAAVTNPITVNKASIDPSVSIVGWTYGETAKTPDVTGNTGNGAVAYSYSGTTRGGTAFGPSANVPTQAGTYIVTATIAETANYLGSTCTKEFAIAPKSVPVTVTAEDKTYDGKTNANVVAAMKASDLVDGDLLEGAVVYEDGMVAFPGLAGTFEDANVGENKKVTLDDSKVAYPVADAWSYEAEISKTPAASILPCPVYVKADDKTSQHGQAIVPLTCSLDDSTTLAKGDTLESLGITASTEASSSSDVGEYPITLAGGTANPNYDVYFVEGGTYTIAPADVSAAKVTLAQTSFTYDGNAKQPAVKVELNGKALAAGSDYSVSYKGNVNPGTATATVTGQGNYAGTATATFTIGLGKAKLSTVAKSKTMAAKWTKVAGAKKYQLQWRVRGGKWKTVAAKSAKATVKGMKAGKLYDFRVRAVSGKAKGAWSAQSHHWFVKQLGIKAQSKKAGALKVSWKKTAKASAGYKVSVGYSKNGKAAVSKTAKAGKASVTVKGLRAGKKAWVQVAPLRKAGGTTYIGILTRAKSAVKIAKA